MTDTDEARRLASDDGLPGLLARARLREGRPLDYTLDRALSEPLEEAEPSASEADDESDVEAVLARARQREGRS